jgi:hypothetical protein
MGNLCTHEQDIKKGNFDTMEPTTQSNVIKNDRKEINFSNFKDKISKIQQAYRKKKENEETVQRIQVLDTNLYTIGKYMTVDEMNEKISPQVQKVRAQLKGIKKENEDKGEENKLIYRKPFQYNLDSSVYQGLWNTKGLREGYGIEVKEDGSVREGVWRDGSLRDGRIYNFDGSYYEGKIYNNEPEGIGKRVTTEGEVFSGLWSQGSQINGERHFNDGHRYFGQIYKNLFHGKGNYIWPDGSTYHGEFNLCSMNGQGKYTSNEGDSYQGDWFNNLPHGTGVYTYATYDGIQEKYEGSYYAGKKEGKGIFTQSNDVSYSGDWKGGLPHGKGIFKIKDKSYSGFWRHGRLIELDDENIIKPEICINVHGEKLKNKNQLFHLNNDASPVNPIKIYKPSIDFNREHNANVTYSTL